MGDSEENINKLIKFIGHFSVNLLKTESLMFDHVSTESLWHPLVDEFKEKSWYLGH